MQEELTIEKAEKFFLNGETRSAGNLAGVLLEQSVQKLCTLHQISLYDLRTRDLLDRLQDAYVISREKHRELQNLVSIRNKCAHPTPVTRDEVQTLIQGTKKFMRWADSQSSIAPARPLATQPPAIRKQLVRGDLIEGVIVRIDRDEILVDIGLKYEGVLPTTELPATGKWAFDQLSLNDKVLLYVAQPETPNGYTWLSLQTDIDQKDKSSRSSSQLHLEGQPISVVLCDRCGDEIVVPSLLTHKRPVYCRFCKPYTEPQRDSSPTSVTSRTFSLPPITPGLDSQSSIAPARPLATQPPAIRKQLVCPLCGKDNRVRKVSGITRNRLLEFPAFPSQSKRERMSNHERSYFVFGWLIVILGFVVLCPLSFAPLNNAATGVGLLIILGMFVSGLFMVIVPRRRAAERLQEDRLRALAIWDTLYYCDRDDALYSSERPEYHVSATNMREMLGY